METSTKNNYLQILLKIEKEETNLFKHISTNLMKYHKNGITIKKSATFCAELNISAATLTKFVKKIKLKNVNELFFLHNEIIRNEKQKLHAKNNQSLVSSATIAIENARKVMFIGVSGSYFTNQDFAYKLQRIDKWVIYPINKYEQIGFARLLNKEDVLIVNSISLQHKWMQEVMLESKAKVILISTSMPKNIEHNIFSFIQIHGDFSVLRLYTTKARIAVIEIYNEIFEQLINNEKNMNLLKITSYH